MKIYKIAEIKSKDDMAYRKREIDISGPDGNAFVLLGIAKKSCEAA